MSSFFALTKLVVHERVVSSTHFSYTRIPNGVIKMITMQDNFYFVVYFSTGYIATHTSLI